MSQSFQSTIDVRTIAPRKRHALIFSTFESLPSGGALQLVNDHDPQPLFHQFAARYPGRFGWSYLEQGPQTWRVAIAKAANECCGACSCS
jgi:uncharacterized protein (DUF2249 family)